MYVPEFVPAEDRRVVEESGLGGSVDLGEDVAVLVVDMTREFVRDEYPHGHAETGEPAAKAIGQLTDAARDRDVTCFYSRALPGTHPAERGRWGDTATEFEAVDDDRTELVAELSPADGDVVFEKYKPSTFFGTQLESMLTHLGVDSLVVTGMTTSGCVRATVVDAFSYNYRVVVPEECVADRFVSSHEMALFDLDMKYADVVPLDDVLGQLAG